MQVITVENTMKKEMDELVEEIKQHNELYEKTQPILTDSEYDNLYMKLVELEANYPELVRADSPTQAITYVKVDGLKEVQHDVPLLSQEKIKDAAGVEKFMAKSDSLLLLQEKMDGLTLSLTYIDGKFTQAVTRGDGTTGQDVTHTVRTIRNIPKEIEEKGKVIVRAEAVIPYAEFERINVDGRYSNSRNLVSGTILQLDPAVAAERDVRAIVLDLILTENLDFDTDTEQIAFMKAQGFDMVPSKAFSDMEEIMNYINEYEDVKRKDLPYMIDGMVLKFDDLGVREELGMGSSYPKWACAYKFSSLNATSTLKDVIIQVGKSGQLTPVGVFEQVVIDNVRIERASLHNFRNLRDKDIRIGDTIIVERANDVIPQIVKSLPETRTGIEEIVVPPTECPACGSKTAFNGENLFCSGSQCTPQLDGKLKHFVSRDAMDIDDLGQKTVSLLKGMGLITSIASFYRLHEKGEYITEMEGFGERSFTKMVEGVEASKKQPFERVLYAFSIPTVGRTASKELAKEFTSIPEMVKAYLADEEVFKARIIAIPKFGTTITGNLISFLQTESNIALINELIGLGLEMKSAYVAPKTDTAIAGKVFVITGALSKGRNEFKADIEALGGKVSGSVSKKTDFLLMGPDAEGTSKHQKAVDLGVGILLEEDCLAML